MSRGRSDITLFGERATSEAPREDPMQHEVPPGVRMFWAL
jgi:hypothetical protein